MGTKCSKISNLIYSCEPQNLIALTFLLNIKFGLLRCLAMNKTFAAGRLKIQVRKGSSSVGKREQQANCRSELCVWKSFFVASGRLDSLNGCA